MPQSPRPQQDLDVVASGAGPTEVGGENIAEKVVATVAGSEGTTSIQETPPLWVENDGIDSWVLTEENGP